MARVPQEVGTLGESSDFLEEFDAEWDRSAFEFAKAASNRSLGLSMEPKLERFLRSYVKAKVRRFLKRASGLELGQSEEDIAQRLFLKLVEVPPRFDEPTNAMRRLTGWVRLTVERHLLDLSAKQREVLEDQKERTSRTESTSARAVFARLELSEVEEIIHADYPAGLPLLRLLAIYPDATSFELAQELGTSIANVDQMRSRIRRVLRKRARLGGES